MKLRIPLDLAERFAHDIGSERTAAHAENDGMREFRGNFFRKTLEVCNRFEEALRNLKPPECVFNDICVLRIARPQRRILRPKFLEEVALTERIERRLISRLIRTERKRNAFRRAAAELLLLVHDRAEQRCKRVTEELHAFDLQLVRDVVKGDAVVGKCVKRLTRLVDALKNGIGLNLSVIQERIQRLRRHRIDRVPPDDGLDVH